MSRYNYVAKKSRKKTKKKTSSIAWMRSACYILGAAVCVWLSYVLWINASGTLAQRTSSYLFQILGQAAGLIPLLLAYWLIQTIRKKSTAFLLFLIGSGVLLCACASLLTCLRLIFTDSQIVGGKIGESVFYAFKGVMGQVGAALFSLAFALVGLQILFAIPWAVVFQKSIEFIKEDFSGWIDARAELKQKVEQGRATVKAKAQAAQVQQEASVAAVAEEIHAMPEIHRAKQEVRHPKAEPITALPRREETAKLPDSKNEPPTDENGETKKFNPATFQLPSLDLLHDPQVGSVVGPTDEEIAKANKKKDTSSSGTGKGGATVTSNTASAAEVALSNDFVANKGKFPWPVYFTKVTREYGRYTHESGGQNMNNGIDLLCKAGASVQAIFNGTVTRIFTCPNGTKGIIIRHGEYMSVYANMGSVAVREGAKVTTKQNIGTVYTNSDGSAEFSFQLWKGTASQNPRSWLR